jgi:hypothetical protein
VLVLCIALVYRGGCVLVLCIALVYRGLCACFMHCVGVSGVVCLFYALRWCIIMRSAISGSLMGTNIDAG